MITRSYQNAFTLMNPKGFTLIELLVVIAILGIIMAAVVAGIDPLDKINSANDAKVQADIGALGTAFEANSVFAGSYATSMNELSTDGDLKAILSAPNTNYTTYTLGCTSGTCTTQSVYSSLRSKKFSNISTTVWKWCSSTGKAGAVSAITSCP